MLLLTRRIGESLVIGNDPDMTKNILVTVVSQQGNQVRIGVTAPKEVPVNRHEVHERIQTEGRRHG